MTLTPPLTASTSTPPSPDSPTPDLSSLDSLTPAAREYLSQPVDHCANIPWPFPDDASEFSYTVNVEPARVPRRTRGGEWGRHLVDLGGAEYLDYMRERRRILDEDPSRVRIMPGMDVACWDLLLYYLRDLALAYPTVMHLTEGADRRFHWRNELLGTDAEFVLGDLESLPCHPLEFLARESPTTCSSSSNATAGSTSTPGSSPSQPPGRWPSTSAWTCMKSTLRYRV